MSGPQFVVKCDGYTIGPFKDRATAERRLKQVEADGHCMYDHEIVEVE